MDDPLSASDDGVVSVPGPLYVNEGDRQREISWVRIVVGLGLSIVSVVFLVGPYKEQYKFMVLPLLSCLWFGVYVFLAYVRVRKEEEFLSHVPRYQAVMPHYLRAIWATVVTIVLYLPLFGGLRMP